MTTFAVGTRVKVTERYAKNIAASFPAMDVEEVGAVGTVKEWSPMYLEVALDEFVSPGIGTYMFYEDELVTV